MDWLRLRNTLKRHEGCRLRPYKDSTGNLTIGYGRNLDSIGITMHEADYLLSGDIDSAVKTARHIVYNFDSLDEVRQEIVVNMAFNIGMKLGGFRKMRLAIAEGDFDKAAEEMLDSRWAKQVGRRATELAEAMRSGQWVAGE